MSRLVVTLVLWSVFAIGVHGQVTSTNFQYDDLGPYQVNKIDSFIPWGAINPVIPAEFQGLVISGFVGYRIYWPSGIDPLQVTPDLFPNAYAPLVMFNHGWASNPADYDGLATHLTSWGMAVAIVNYNVFPVEAQRPVEQAYESWLLKHYLLNEAADPTSNHPVRGVLSPDVNQEVAACGHSMGGVASVFLAGVDSKVKTIVAMEPFEQTEIAVFGTCSPLALFNGSAAAEVYAENFEGSVFLFEGNSDQLVNGSVDFWFNKFSDGPVTPRRLAQLSVDGVGHFGCTDVALSTVPFFPCGITELGDMDLFDQHLVHRRFATMCLLSEFTAEGFENNFVDLFGDGFCDEDFGSIAAGADIPVGFSVQSNCPDAIIWAKEVATPWDTACVSLGPPTRPNSVAFGVMGIPGDLDATYLLVPLSIVGGVCPPGTFQVGNSCVITMYNNVALPAGSLSNNGVRECNFGIVAGGFTVEMVSYLWRNGPFDLTRLAGFFVSP